jgi:TatD DNase family protein
VTADRRRQTADGSETQRSSVGRRWSLVDTHCHLDLHQFHGDRHAVMNRAAAVGVGTIVNPAIDLDSCRRVLALAEEHPNVYAAVGVHPNDCADFDDEALAELRILARHPRVVAIGEIGLDDYWNKVPHDQQVRALRAQLALAAEFDLPVILHSRNARGDETGRCNAELLREIEQWGAAARTQRGEDAIIGIWHAFSGGLDEAQAAYGAGFVLGLGGPVTFQNARGLRALVPQLRLDRLVLETDAPYLAPHPHRGQRNEPAYIPLIVQGLANQLGTTPETVAAQTTLTADVIFRPGRT